MTTPDHVAENQRYWDGMADAWVAAGERLWALDAPSWGQWGFPDTDYALLPDDMAGLDAIELGCGTGYVSGWMVRRGATVTAIDNSSEQLATARRLAAEHDIDVDFIHGNAESVPRGNELFDFAVSEYGAAIWCDPKVWLREVYRLLRPGGQLVFLGNTPLSLICQPLDGSPAGYTLERNYFELGTIDWRDVQIDPGGVEFNLPFSGWLRLFRDIGFEVDDYHEVKAPDSAEGTPFAIGAEWSKRYPSEHVWKVSKPGPADA